MTFGEFGDGKMERRAGGGGGYFFFSKSIIRGKIILNNVMMARYIYLVRLLPIRFIIFHLLL